MLMIPMPARIIYSSTVNQSTPLDISGLLFNGFYFGQCNHFFISHLYITQTRFQISHISGKMPLPVLSYLALALVSVEQNL